MNLSVKPITGHNLLTFLFTIVLSSSIYCQDSVWWTYELEGIGVDFPIEEVSQMDTIMKGVPIKMLLSQYENSTLILQQQFAGANILEFPHDHKTLIEYHDGVIEGMKNGFDSEVKKEEINQRGFIGIKATFIKDSKPFSESNVFLVGNHLIIITYHNTEPFNDEVKDEFFSSLNFGDLEPSTQMLGESKAYRRGYFFGKLAFYAILGIGAFFVIRSLRKK